MRNERGTYVAIEHLNSRESENVLLLFIVLASLDFPTTYLCNARNYYVPSDDDKRRIHIQLLL